MFDSEFVNDIVEYFNTHHSTVRETAEHFDVSKSTVHRYLTKVKPNATSREILEYNKSVWHIRGGQATKNKYQSKRS